MELTVGTEVITGTAVITGAVVEVVVGGDIVVVESCSLLTTVSPHLH